MSEQGGGADRLQTGDANGARLHPYLTQRADRAAAIITSPAASPSASIVTMTCASPTASAGVAATDASSAFNASAFAWVRFHAQST